MARTIAFQDDGTRPLMDVVLIAAAADNDWLLPGHARGKALKVVNRLLLVSNSCDKVLRFYRFFTAAAVVRRRWATAEWEASASWGPMAGRLPSSTPVAWSGPEHYWANYFASPAVVGRLLPYVFRPPAAQRQRRRGTQRSARLASGTVASAEKRGAGSRPDERPAADRRAKKRPRAALRRGGRRESAQRAIEPVGRPLADAAGCRGGRHLARPGVSIRAW